MLAKDNYT